MITIWDHTDGCANLYHFAYDIHLPSYIALEFIIIIDRAVGAPVHSRYVIDGMNATDKCTVMMNEMPRFYVGKLLLHHYKSDLAHTSDRCSSVIELYLHKKTTTVWMNEMPRFYVGKLLLHHYKSD